MNQKGKIIPTIGELMKQNYDMVSMGIKPSGEIHLGSVTTILIGLSYVSRHPDSVFDIRIMDLDYDRKLGKNFTPYIHRFSEKKNKTAREALREELTDLVELADEQIANLRIGKEFEDNKNVIGGFFSELLYTQEYAEFFSNLLTDQNNLKIINKNLFGHNDSKSIPISGICPSCYLSSPTPAKHGYDPDHANKLERRKNHAENVKDNMKWDLQLRTIMKCEQELKNYELQVDSIVGGNKDNRKYVLKSKCQNDDCETQQYFYDMRTTPANVHYMIDPLRDSIIAKDKSIVHLYGGDYGLPIGKRNVNRAQIVVNNLHDLNLHPVDAYIGPLLAMHGKKMGKSGSSLSFNGMTLNEKRNFMKTMLNLIWDNNKIIHYKDIKEHL